MQYLELILITGRSLGQGFSMKGEGKFSIEYLKSVATAEINPEDFKKLGGHESIKIRGVNDFELTLYAKPNPNIPIGRIFLPLGPFANVLIDSETRGTGMPGFKGVTVKVFPTDEKPSTIEALLIKFYGKKPLVVPIDLKLVDGEKRVIHNVVCTICGMLCDFITLELIGNRVVRNIGGCALSTSKYLNYYKHRIVKPYIRNGDTLKEVSMEEAIEVAAKILAESKYPLLFGWSNTCTEAIELGIELAELVGGVIDNTTTVCHGPTAISVEEVGTVSTTWGVILNIADVIVFWGSNAAEAHVNALSRYISRGGIFKPSGRKERKVIVIDVRRTALASVADLYIEVEPGKDLELIEALRMAIRDLEIEQEKIAGVPREKVLELAEILRTARYGVALIGMGLTQTRGKFLNLTRVIRLIQDLNEWSRWVLLPMRGHYNVTGAMITSLYLTGYPFARDFHRGFPKMIPGVTTAVDLLENGDVDAALIVASDPVAHLPIKAVENLVKIPIIAIDSKWSLTAALADVIIPVGMVGVECEGSAYRMDGIALKVKKIVDPPPGVLCDVDVLKILIDRVKKLRGVAK